MSQRQTFVAVYVDTGGGSAKDSMTLLCNEQEVLLHDRFVPSLSSPVRRYLEDVSRPCP